MRNKQNRLHLSRTTDRIDPVSQKSWHYKRLSEIYGQSFDWVTKLRGHTSCVNAVNFSQKGGRWLASGGDDLRVLLWDMHETEIKTPIHTFTGPRRNIFELAFTANNEYLLCGGADASVQRYDFTRIGQSFDPDPVNTFTQHRDSIRSITPHIINDALYMTASEEGRLFYHDARSPKPSGHLVSQGGWVGAQFHPRLEHLFIGATDQRRGKITLFDMRNCFGRTVDAESKELMRYATQPIADRPLSTSLCDIAFDRSGEIFATTNQHHYPTVYALSDPYPIAVCTAERLPSGEPTLSTQRSYGNSCTTKHLSFGGPPCEVTSGSAANDADQYLATGSDDFRGYVWEIPSTTSLLAEREEIENDDGDWSPEKGQFGYILSALDQTLHIPVNLNQPSFRLGGHQSIVNTARWHPVMPRIATCGIESKVVLHEYCGSLAGSVKTDSSKVRRRSGSSVATMRRSRLRTGPAAALTVNEMTGEESEDISDEEDSSTIHYFDDILADEAERNRARSNRPASVGDGEDSDELRGGPGDLVESDDGFPRDRARLLAIFARLLASGDDLDGGVTQMDAFQFLRAMAEDGEEESTPSEGSVDAEQQMDTSE